MNPKPVCRPACSVREEALRAGLDHKVIEEPEDEHSAPELKAQAFLTRGSALRKLRLVTSH